MTPSSPESQHAAPPGAAQWTHGSWGGGFAAGPAVGWQHVQRVTRTCRILRVGPGSRSLIFGLSTAQGAEGLKIRALGLRRAIVLKQAFATGPAKAKERTASCVDY